jgi:hypothetical protein
MTRIELIPLPTADGRRIVLQAVPVTARERLRRLARRLAARRR